jgi:hypothetical protein
VPWLIVICELKQDTNIGINYELQTGQIHEIFRFLPEKIDMLAG